MLLALLVQLVERRSPKPDVVGSSPTGRVSISKYIKNLIINYILTFNIIYNVLELIINDCY
jgi:hypothetical protein